MGSPFIEIIPTASEGPIEVSVEAPWVTPLTFSITLHNSETSVIVPNDIFNDATTRNTSISISTSEPKDLFRRNKWSLPDAETRHEVGVKEDFLPFCNFSSIEGRVDIEIDEERRRVGRLLQPNESLQMAVFQFKPFAQKAEMTIGSLQSSRTYELCLNRTEIGVYRTEAKSQLDLARLRREGHPLFSTSVSVLPIHVQANNLLTLRTTTKSPPWIEAQINPCTSSFDLANPDEGLSLILNLTLHSSQSSIIIPSEFTILESITALSQAGGLISFVDTETGIPAPRPEAYVNRVKTKSSLLGNNHYTLSPEQPITVRHPLIAKSLSGQTLEERVKFNGFQVGKNYSIVLDRRCTIAKWLPGGKIQSLLSRVASGTGWSGEEIGWEEGRIPVIQRSMESFAIVRA